MLCVPMSPYGFFFFLLLLFQLFLCMPLLWPPCMVFIIDPQREQMFKNNAPHADLRERIFLPLILPHASESLMPSFMFSRPTIDIFFSGPLSSGSSKDRYFNLLLGAHLKDKVILFSPFRYTQSHWGDPLFHWDSL